MKTKRSIGKYAALLVVLLVDARAQASASA